jgi:hypothetical protein
VTPPANARSPCEGGREGSGERLQAGARHQPGISVRDASHAVLAGELGVPVISSDLRLVRALRAAGESAIYLDDLDG